RATKDVDFLVGQEAFRQGDQGVLSLRVPIYSVSGVPVQLLPPPLSGLQFSAPTSPISPDVRIEFIAASGVEKEAGTPVFDGNLPIAPLPVVVYTKLNAGRSRDVADIIELVKRGRIDVPSIDRYLASHAPQLLPVWTQVKAKAATEAD